MTIKKLTTNALLNGTTRKTVTLKLQARGLLNCRRIAGDELLKKRRHDDVEHQMPEDNKLFSNQILDSLPAGNLARLSPDLESIYLPAGEELNKPGEPIDYVYFPEDATVSQFQVLTDGSTAEIVMVGREGIVGLDAVFGSRAPSFWAQTITPGAAFRVKTDLFRREFQHSPRLQSLLFGYANSYIALISQRVSCSIRHVAGARFCTWLLMLHDRTGGNELRLTHEQIAVCLGINRPTVTTFAKSLRDDGLIDYFRGRIRIHDRRRLEAAACECYATVRNYLSCDSRTGAVLHQNH